MARFIIGKIVVLAALVGGGAAAAVGTLIGDETPQGLPMQKVTDMLHAVMEADRTAYTQRVVDRLQNQQKVILADEHFEDKKALPLPAQMFRFGAEKVAEKEGMFAYSLVSSWAINRQNAPKTEAEKTGLKHVAETKQPFYGQESLGGKTYFTAVYPDFAVSAACVACHNDHADSPRKDFKTGDVMGGIVIRIVQ